MNNFPSIHKIMAASCMLLITISCSSTRDVQQVKPADTFKNNLAQLFKNSDILNSHFVGFELYDPQADSVIYAQNEKKYFIPASNTKLYTFYAALKYLPGKIPALKYVIKGDSLIFWGTGDPSFLRKDRDNGRVYRFLANSSKQLYFSDANFRERRFGSAWSWSWYSGSWSKERTPLPMYGNSVHFSTKKVSSTGLANKESGMQVFPSFFSSYLIHKKPQKGRQRAGISRGVVNNQFMYAPKSSTSQYSRNIPYHYTPQLITAMLSDTLHKSVKYIHMEIPSYANTIYSVPSDSIYKRMLLPSDNFIAEQLLLVIAASLDHSLNTRWAIRKMERNYLKDIPNEPEWVDGSGLSHRNMFTPRAMIWLLQRIRVEFPNDKELFELLPAGGERGTISKLFIPPEGEKPYVFAKTGTLSHTRCLSGFIKTKSGQVLLFSFMNNHYRTSTSYINKAMEKVLLYIYQNY